MALVSLVSHNWHLLEETVWSGGCPRVLQCTSNEMDLAVSLSHASLLSLVKHSAGLTQTRADASQLFSCGTPVA